MLLNWKKSFQIMLFQNKELKIKIPNQLIERRVAVLYAYGCTKKVTGR